MRKRYDPAPVSEYKIEMINTLLASYPVNELWIKYVAMGSSNASAKDLNKAFDEYAHFRDLFLGLPPLKADPVKNNMRVIVA